MQRLLIDVWGDITIKEKTINISQYSYISEISIESYHSPLFVFSSNQITYLQPKDKSYEFEVVRLKLDTYTAQSHLIWNVVFPISNPHLQDLFELAFARLF